MYSLSLSLSLCVSLSLSLSLSNLRICFITLPPFNLWRNFTHCCHADRGLIVHPTWGCRPDRSLAHLDTNWCRYRMLTPGHQ